jgi:hypothetical protein
MTSMERTTLFIVKIYVECDGNSVNYKKLWQSPTRNVGFCIITLLILRIFCNEGESHENKDYRKNDQ